MKLAHKESWFTRFNFRNRRVETGKIILKNMKTGQQTLLSKDLNHLKLS